MAKKPKKPPRDLWNLKARPIPKGSVRELEDRYVRSLTAGPNRLPATKR